MLGGVAKEYYARCKASYGPGEAGGARCESSEGAGFDQSSGEEASAGVERAREAATQTARAGARAKEHTSERGGGERAAVEMTKTKSSDVEVGGAGWKLGTGEACLGGRLKEGVEQVTSERSRFADLRSTQSRELIAAVAGRVFWF